MKTIIVPTDFTHVSANAADFAAKIALTLQADLLLVNVYNLPVAYSGEVPLMMTSLEALKSDSEKNLESLKMVIIEHTGGMINVLSEARLGNTIDELQNICEEIKPFAVVMGIKSKNALEKFAFGSTTLSAIRHLNWPVICVPNDKKYGTGIKKIGFASDFKDVNQTTPSVLIKNIVREFKAELHILNVDHQNKHFRPDTPEESRALHEMFEDLNPVFHYITNPDIEAGIDEFAEANHLDLVIAVPKKHKLLEAIFKQSCTRQLVFQSHVPVMCVHD